MIPFDVPLVLDSWGKDCLLKSFKSFLFRLEKSKLYCKFYLTLRILFSSNGYSSNSEADFKLLSLI